MSPPPSFCSVLFILSSQKCELQTRYSVLRRHYSFQPISPKSGGGGGLQSPPASPFVSPRSTPVHMLRSRHSSGSALPLYLLPGGTCLLFFTTSGYGGKSVPDPWHFGVDPDPRIHDIFVWIRIRGSMPLTNGSEFGSRSCYFRHWPSVPDPLIRISE